MQSLLQGRITTKQGEAGVRRARMTTSKAAPMPTVMAVRRIAG